METIDAFMGCDNMRLVVHPPPSGELNIKRDCVEVETRNDTEGSITVCQCSRTQEIVVSKQVTWKWNEAAFPMERFANEKAKGRGKMRFCHKLSKDAHVSAVSPQCSGAVGVSPSVPVAT